MARYLVQASYTPESWAAQLENPQDRRQVVEPLLQRLGGRFETLDYAFGEYDIIAIVELPDNVSAAAVGLAIMAGGAMKAYKTTPLLSSSEGLQAMRRAAEAASTYQPPIERGEIEEEGRWESEGGHPHPHPR
jgi:uncharacterized protein with GYD domain